MLHEALARAGVLKRCSPDLYDRGGVPKDPALVLTFLGTTGFVIEARGRTLVLDPYVSRPGLRRTVLTRIRPDRGAIRRHIPVAHDVACGHAHHDHALDAPELCHQTGARLIGSPDVAMVGRAAGLPEDRLVVTRGREDLASGPLRLRGFPSRHGKPYLNQVFSDGTIDAPPPWPPRYTDLKAGLKLDWLVDVGGVRLMHIDESDFREEELAGTTVDVLCLCAIGRRFRPNYVRDAVRILRPKVVIPCHWDLYTGPLEDEPYLLPQVDLEGFLAEIREAGARPVLLPLRGRWGYAA